MSQELVINKKDNVLAKCDLSTKNKILEIKAFIPDIDKIKYQLYYEANGREIYILQTKWNRNLKKGLIFTLYKVDILENTKKIKKINDNSNNPKINKKALERKVAKRVSNYFNEEGNRWSLGCMTFKSTDDFNYQYLKEYINKLSIDKVIEKLHNYSDLCFEYKELIVTYRLDDLINKLNNGSVNKYFEYISLYHYTDELIINTIDKKIFDDGVIDLLNNNHYNNDIINFILKYKSEYIKNILVNIDFDNLIYNKNKTDKYFDIINSLPKNIQNKIYKRKASNKS